MTQILVFTEIKQFAMDVFYRNANLVTLKIMTETISRFQNSFAF